MGTSLWIAIEARRSSVTVFKYIQVADPNHKQLLDSAKMSHYNVKWSKSTLRAGLEEIYQNPERKVFLEQGNDQAGLEYISKTHKAQFYLLGNCQGDGVRLEKEISDYINRNMAFDGLNANPKLIDTSNNIFTVVYETTASLYLHVALDPHGRILYAFPSETEDFLELFPK